MSRKGEMSPDAMSPKGVSLVTFCRLSRPSRTRRMCPMEPGESSGVKKSRSCPGLTAAAVVEPE